ncbi:hypothetical protein [Paenarthrobacter sp. PH39-S1]|uniref:hypothetical protein n=1 Tax=Paenarthrobacter sp. PH39-S1 TaxID=3046204 RepID=UPI0024BA3C54|nr:hypothetical protein [Paenarthrobacter sp. PH39-S1]MDJ0357531.1 hypothetical protein [Paenarthrobacter sp. PH39-S1]
MLKPVTATVVILAGVAIWNDYSMSVYLPAKPSVQTIARAIGSPVLVAYLFLQKYFIKGMVAGAEK